MPFKIQVGPPRIAIHQGLTVLVTAADGQISGGDQQGLFFRDTRLISSWSLSANGTAWEVLSGGAMTHDIARIHLTNMAIPTGAGEIPRRTLSLVIGRAITGGMHEDLTITNHGQQKIRFDLQLHLATDFADLFEAKSGRRPARGTQTSVWVEAEQAWHINYQNQDFRRGLRIRVDGADPRHQRTHLTFTVALDPGRSWHTCLLYEPHDGGLTHPAQPDCTDPVDTAQPWRESVLRIEAADSTLQQFCDQATDDLAALRLPMDCDGTTVTMPAAGLPWFVAPFGRDSLIVSMQAMMLDPDFALGSLTVLGHWQAKAIDDLRDAEPGKIMHELRCGELAHFQLIPHTPYYGTADATPLFLITLHEAWKATGDRALLDRHLPRAEAALAWIDAFGDRDGDGFQEYQARAKGGYENMGWKDSGDAINHPDGTPVAGPKALCELQGYVYDAWRRMAEVFDALGQPGRGAALRAKAAALFDRFNAAFWDEDIGFYALTLDGAKRKVMSIASNAGHLLWSGLVPPDRAARVVRRLMADDMYSGWGIRTLSSRHPSYNPLSYQNGAVWPHDNSLIALGMRRYGFAAEAATLARVVSEASGHFQSNQIPELYAGLPRGPMSFPVRYAGANVPQAWAAGSAFALLNAMMGIAPDAPNGRLYIDPVLPDWLPAITLRNLRCGSARYDLICRRDGEIEILRGDPATVLRGVRPGMETAGHTAV